MSRLIQKPRVVLLDDVSFEWQEFAMLLQRDVRTEIDLDKRFSRPETLLRHARKCIFKPDLVLIDAGYRDPSWPLLELLKEISRLLPQSRLVCLAQHANANTLYAALGNGRNGGAHGFWLKEDVRYGIAAMVCIAANLDRHTFSYTPGGVKMLNHHFPQKIDDGIRLPRWRIYDCMPPRLQEAAILLHLRGMAAPAVARVMGTDNPTVHTYKNRIFRDYLSDVWASGWYEEYSLQPFMGNFQDLKDRDVRDAWVFHVLTSLPRYVG